MGRSRPPRRYRRTATLRTGDDGCRFEKLERRQTVFEIGLTSQDALLDERGRGRIRRRGSAQRAGERLARGRMAHVSQDFDRPLIGVELLLARVGPNDERIHDEIGEPAPGTKMPSMANPAVIDSESVRCLSVCPRISCATFWATSAST